MATILIIAIMVCMSMPLLQQQMAVREIESVARRFIQHAQFARQQALYLGQTVRIEPCDGVHWDSGWVVRGGGGLATPQRDWFLEGAVYPVYFKDGGKQFTDPHSLKKGIAFNGAGAAKTGQGGFVANRFILGHDHAPDLERHLILSSGGRWRICNPQTDLKRCR